MVTVQQAVSFQRSSRGDRYAKRDHYNIYLYHYNLKQDHRSSMDMILHVGSKKKKIK